MMMMNNIHVLTAFIARKNLEKYPFLAVFLFNTVVFVLLVFVVFTLAAFVLCVFVVVVFDMVVFVFFKICI